MTSTPSLNTPMKATFNPTLSHFFSKSLKAGFSLVEVVLAVGIMGLGVVTILGLLPHGLDISRKTANEQAQTRIVDQISGELQSSDWVTLGGVVGAPYVYQFDDQGLRTLDDNVTSYVARVRLPEQTEGDNGMRVPGRTVDGVRNRNLRRVSIEVATAQTRDFNFDSPPAGAPVKRFTTLVAKMRP